MVGHRHFGETLLKFSGDSREQTTDNRQERAYTDSRGERGLPF
jgi:hypothetical protein